MDKSLRIVIYIVLALTFIDAIITFFEKSQLKQIQKNIEASQRNIDTALNYINASRLRLDSLQGDVDKFKYYIKNIQTNVSILNTKKEIEEAKSNAKLKETLDELNAKVKNFKEELKTTDSLPPIEVKPL
jgi:chromosome segregation ATPase